MSPRLTIKMDLLTKFTITATVLILAIATTLAWGLQKQIETNALQQEAENAADQVANLLTPYLRPEDLTSPINPARYAEMDALIRDQVLSDTHVLRVKIWNRDGELIYSDDRELVGRQFPLSHELEEALAGEIGMEVSSLMEAENVGEQGLAPRLIEIYVPVRLPASTEVLGAYEIYHALTIVEERIVQMRKFVVFSVGIGFLVLYASLFTLVRNASRELIRRNRENAELYAEAKQQLTERIRAEEQLQRQLQRITALRQIDRAITASLDKHVTLNVLLDQVTAQLRVDAASILLLNPHMNILEFAAGRGFLSDEIRHIRVRVGEGYIGRVALDRRTIRQPDLGSVDSKNPRVRLFSAEKFVVYGGTPLIAKGQVKGVLEVFHRSSLEMDEEWLEFLETLAGQAAIAIDNAELFDNLQRSNVELSLAYDATIKGWSHALDLRDKETEGHTLRVTEMCERLARASGMSEADLVHLRRGALLHDIGKMGVPDAILLKPGKLTNEEWETMRQHPRYAYEMLSSIAYLRPALDIPCSHHERWDGTGYPQGLKGEQIPLAARLFSVVDVWDALTSDRPYRNAWSKQEALAYIRSMAGTQFDPQVVEAFLAMVEGDE